VLHALGLLGAVIISFSAIMVRLADVSPSTAAFYRAAYALPVLLVLYALTRGDDTRTSRQRRVSLLAGLFMGGAFTLWNHAIGFVGAGLATVLGNTQVVFIGLYSWWVLRERSAGALLAAPIVFAGVVLVSGVGRSDAYGEEPLLGTLFGVLNALAYTAFLLMFRHAGRRERRPAGLLLDATLGAALAGLVLGLLTDGRFDLAPSWPGHGWLVLLALGSQVVGWWIILTVLPRLPVLDTSVLLLVQPVLTVVWGRLLFAEILSPLQLGGVVLVVVGVGVLALRSARAAQARRPAETADR
jgi:drug/metabolite transporter (DMT)-like permease